MVIIVKENHAFDNYFGRFPGVDGDPNHGEFKVLGSTFVLFRVQWTGSYSSSTARAWRPR